MGRIAPRLLLAIITQWAFVRSSIPRADRCAKEISLGPNVRRWPNTLDKSHGEFCNLFACRESQARVFRGTRACPGVLIVVVSF